MVLTTLYYVAGRLCHHKENHTFDLCESLTIHDIALQHMATSGAPVVIVLMFYVFFYILEKIFHYIIILKKFAQKQLASVTVPVPKVWLK